MSHTNPVALPDAILAGMDLAHPSWHATLRSGLEAVVRSAPGYLSALAADHYLPTQARLFAAFSQPLDAVRHVLVGEGPYPRPESATGYCFMDGAVGDLWSATGLSKRVNRATSLRNFMKMLLVADGRLSPAATSGDAMAHIGMQACSRTTELIGTLDELQDNMHRNGFLLLNAALAFRPHVPPPKEAKAWQPFLSVVLDALAGQAEAARRQPPSLVLWGKIAEKIVAMPVADRFPKAVCEHPYNLTFIKNPGMQEFFRPMKLLQKQA